VYPALAVLERLAVEQRVEVLWVGAEGGMEVELVTRAGIRFTDCQLQSIPAAGVHGVGLRALPGNLIRLARGYAAARRLLQQFQPNVLFFTGGYVAGPVALAGSRRGVPTLIYVPDIEPGLALKLLSRFADRIAVSAEEARAYFSRKERVVVTGYPLRPQLEKWSERKSSRAEACKIFGLAERADLPILLATGGSLGALSINQALTAALPELLSEMQIIHLTGARTWEQFAGVAATLPADLAPRYKAYPYLHTEQEMGAAFAIAELVVSRAGASCLGEYPHFGLPAILAPYPHAWRYQKVNADYLAQRGAAVILEDELLPEKLPALILDLMRDTARRARMRRAMQSLAGSENGGAPATAQIAAQLIELVDQSRARPRGVMEP